jgi:hypothetical protein
MAESKTLNAESEMPTACKTDQSVKPSALSVQLEILVIEYCFEL